ncbi:tyrosine-protein kinase [Mesonia sp. K7]|uniref:GumC family protein n=1 Tax=Mesonia sp. K7 TaxID=2218606 RepID=UPI000DAA71C2|nr:tyrosine-protein kinase [Mesonia sp. K7]PZD77689.1 capsule biosynthesis protein [Mesonia sp. K7]
MEEIKNHYEDQAGGEDLKLLIYKYLQYWPWFLLSIIICLITAFLYLRYSTNIYETQAKVKILDESNDGGVDLSGLSGSTSLFNLSKVNLENEIEIFKSRRLLKKVVDEENLNTRFYNVATIKSALLHNKEVPIKIFWYNKDSLANPSVLFRFERSVNSNTFKITPNDGEVIHGKYNELVSSQGYSFKIEKTTTDKSNILSKETVLHFQFIPTDKAISQLNKGVLIAPVGKESHILQIKLQGENANKNEAIINNLINQFNQDGIEDKRLVSKRTQEFVEDRLVFLEQELDTVETEIVDFKQDNDILTVETTAEQLLGKEAESEKKRVEAEIQLEITKDFKDVLLSQEKYNLLPANIGIQDGSVNNLTEQYNRLVQERNALLVGATESNPAVININQQLESIQQNIISSVNAYINALQLQLNSIQRQENISSGQLASLPAKEKIGREIYRQQDIKEKLYLFLLQRREEAALSYATTAPTIKVVDFAYTGSEPVSPKRMIILLAALILGLLLPFGFFYLYFLLDTKINSKQEVSRLLPQVSVVGELPQLDKTSHQVVLKNDRSILAEAFRILRTNLNYFKNSEAEKGQVVYVTSTTKGEGKTFTAVNLANSMASTKKKVLLVGCDLRNPQIHTYINKDKNHIGVSNFLYDSSTALHDIIIKNSFDFSNLDVILSGSIPPNPAELLMSTRFQQLLEEAKALYDIVIVDSAPTILVTDTLLISKYADLTLYMVRAGYTETKLLQHIEDLRKNNKLQSIGIVLNGVKAEGAYGYNYGYGYGYEADKVKGSPAWMFWKR